MPNDVAMSRNLSALLMAVSTLGLAALAIWPLLLATLEELCAATDVVALNRCRKAPDKLRSYVAMLAAFPAVLLLERLWPARRVQRLFAPGVLVDFLWFCCTPVFLVAFILPAEEALRWLQTRFFDLQPLVSLHALSLGAQIAIVIVLADFLHYVGHLIRHKSSFVWEFHKIHHAQQELNYFTAARIHPIDALVSSLVKFVPFALLEANVAVPAFVLWRVFVNIYAMYTHSNIRLSMGPLRYILVTPQSHRIHHSCLPEHRDRNFGNLLSVWDFLFGTQCRQFEVYPRTGVEDKNVPCEREPSLCGAIASFARMLLYPLRSLRRSHLTPERES